MLVGVLAMLWPLILDKSLNSVLDNNTIAAVIMAVSAYPENVTICCHGIRAIEWILEAGGTQVVRMILDEDVLKLCTDLVAIHNDSELLRFICGVAGKICRYSGKRGDAMIVRVPRTCTECTGRESVRGESGRNYEEI